MFAKIDCRGLSYNSSFAQRLYSSFVRGSSNLNYTKFLKGRYIHGSPILQSPRRRDFFSSNATLQAQPQDPPRNGDNAEYQQPQPRKGSRLPVGKTSLRRVAVEAQRSRDGIATPGKPALNGLPKAKVKPLVIAQEHVANRYLV